jgi:phosphate:Na+ symporter
MEKITPYVALVTRFINFIKSHLNEHVDSQDMAVAVKIENEINKMRNILKQSASKRLQGGSDVRSELLFIDVVRHVEQIGDHLMNITESLEKI